MFLHGEDPSADASAWNPALRDCQGSTVCGEDQDERQVELAEVLLGVLLWDSEPAIWRSSLVVSLGSRLSD